MLYPLSYGRSCVSTSFSSQKIESTKLGRHGKVAKGSERYATSTVRSRSRNNGSVLFLKGFKICRLHCLHMRLSA